MPERKEESSSLIALPRNWQGRDRAVLAVAVDERGFWAEREQKKVGWKTMAAIALKTGDVCREK